VGETLARDTTAEPWPHTKKGARLRMVVSECQRVKKDKKNHRSRGGVAWEKRQIGQGTERLICTH